MLRKALAVKHKVVYENCRVCGKLCNSNECTSCHECSDIAVCEGKRNDSNVVRNGYCPGCERTAAFACVSCGTLFACVGHVCSECSSDKHMLCLEKEPKGKKIVVAGTCDACKTAKLTWEKIAAEEKRPRELNGENVKRLLWTFKGYFIKIARLNMTIKYQCPGFVSVVSELIENGMSLRDAKKALDEAMDEAIFFAKNHDPLRTKKKHSLSENRCPLFEGCPIRDKGTCNMDKFPLCYARKYVQKGYKTEFPTFDYRSGACVRML